MNPAILAATLWLRITGPEPAPGPAATLREERRAAHRSGEPRRELELVQRELAALAADSQQLAAACDAVQAGYRVCSERLPELGCAGGYLQRYADTGCLTDALQWPRYHYMWALHWQRQLEFTEALAALRRVVEAAQPLFLARLFRSDPQGAAEFLDLTRDLAASAAVRTEIAAHLRNRVAWQRSFAALSLFLEVLASEGDAYAAAILRNQVAWGLLVLREAGLQVADPVPLLTDALTTFTRDGTRDRSQANNVRINLALAALQRGALADVDRALAGLDDAAMSPEERMWLDIVRLRAALARGRLDEAAQWQQSLADAEPGAFVPMGPWFVAWTRGLVAEARGDRDAAIAAYQVAEALLEAHAHARDVAAYGAAADGRFRMFAATTRRLLDLRIGDGDVRAALWLARNARNRALRMHARQWCQEAERPRDDAPGPGALHLLYFPLDPAGPGDLAPWLGFAVTAAGVRAELLDVAPIVGDAHRLSRETLSTFSEQLLAPFAADIDAAEVVTIFPTDALHDLPFHALPWDGGILLDAAPVQYGLDIAACDDPSPRAAAAALVVSGGDFALPEEGRAVTAALQAGGVPVRHLAAEAPEPFAPLLTGGLALAHLAAHGQHPVDEAVFAADVQLVFGGARVLTREAILAAPAVPRLVYLSACRSSFVDADTLGGGLSLAHAFLLRGARQVVGSVRDVDADATRTFALEFYAALAAPEGDVAAAWRTAYLSARASLEPSLQGDLRMLRLFVP
ncbi:CHAT domain-containing protein [Nannocystis bainbridge]|uniref:CHAT domain-containing protein n=1 Tax=Nannocystis bainbridge TaxID=2995303 RepID=A0ABT5EEQ2_9BACT|nr:CHAT domain-containing protein [Nannocystis bainbridge]MDC0723302.1 CHAT domain-containing protein [Nannocystis bainbridge]